MSGRFPKAGFVFSAIGYAATVIVVVAFGASRFTHLYTPGVSTFVAAAQSGAYHDYLGVAYPILAMLVGVPAGLFGAHRRRLGAGFAGLCVGVIATAIAVSFLPKVYWPTDDFAPWLIWLTHLYVFVGAWGITALLVHLFRRDPAVIVASLCYFFTIGAVVAWGITHHWHLARHIVAAPADLAAFAAYGRFLRLTQPALAVFTGVWAGLLGDHYRRQGYGLVGLALGAAIVTFAFSYLPGYHHLGGHALPQQMWLAQLYLAVGAWAVTAHLLFHRGRAHSGAADEDLTRYLTELRGKAREILDRAITALKSLLDPGEVPAASSRFLRNMALLATIGYIAAVVFFVALGMRLYSHLYPPGPDPEAGMQSIVRYDWFLFFTQPVLAMLAGVPAGLFGAYRRRARAGFIGLCVGVIATAVGYSLLPTLYFPGGSFSAWGLWLAHLYIYVGAWGVTALLSHLLRRNLAALIVSLSLLLVIGVMVAWEIAKLRLYSG